MRGGLRKTRIVFEIAILCLPKAPGCQLLEAATSVGCRFSGSSQTSNCLAVYGRYTAFGLMSLGLNVRFGSLADILRCESCPLYPRKRTFRTANAISVTGR
jgi:hypothetical protein